VCSFRTRSSIDDFGTGFLSLTHLQKPLHEIKIDQLFISGMLDRENDYIIARSNEFARRSRPARHSTGKVCWPGTTLTDGRGWRNS
jgi:predicted signal transduction protein with EAL and GGDEF domain